MTEQQMVPMHETCPECQVGALEPTTVSYYAVLEGQLLSIPDFPAWMCDVCRHCEYDERALADLRAILGPAARLPLEPSRRRRRANDAPSSWTRGETTKE